jgi:hypothetical protein
MREAAFPADGRTQKRTNPVERFDRHEALVFTKRVLGKAIPALVALCVALLFVRGAQTGDHQGSPTLSNKTSLSLMVPALGLAMADFTGDTHPDLATVQLERFDSPSARYSIEIRLSEGGRQSLKLTAPFGGLLITPKDVTGDGNLDLIVRSARSHVPVAIFLNNGRGHFSPAALSSFAQALRDVPYELGNAAEQPYFGATLIPPESYTAACRNASIRDQRRQDGMLPPANFGVPSHSFLPFGSNRAPPTVA